MKIMTIVGARPEFIQTAPVCKAIRKHHTEILVHTGQHYDGNMSDVFFEELGLPHPDLNFGVGSGSHAWQTGQIMLKTEEALLVHRPDWVVVFGDTNTTLAATLAAAKLHIPVAHIEAGLRSFDRAMPEEINRVAVDHLSQLLLVPTRTAVVNLSNEGITTGVHQVGDVRVDVLTDMRERALARRGALLARLALGDSEPFALATIHRPSNTDEINRLRPLLANLNSLGIPVVLPVHPRLHKMMGTFGLAFGSMIRASEPLGFLDMLALLAACEVVITDSGGLQKEAYMVCKPAVTVRTTTEWTETVDAGWNRLCEPAHLVAAVRAARTAAPEQHPDYYGTYGVGERIASLLA